MPKYLLPSQKLRILQYLKRVPRWSNERIARATGVSRESVRRCRLQFGIPTASELQHQAIRDELQNVPGISLSEVARRLGISESTVRKIAKDLKRETYYGLPL